MAKQKKEEDKVNSSEILSDESILKDISLASKLLAEGNKKLSTKIKRYENEISILK